VAIRTAIVDDEPLARSNLSLLLRLDPEIEIVSECGSGADAPDVIRRTKPDLLFLDVQMPEYDGFDVLELLGKDVPPALVFVTAYDQYALRAFEQTLARAKQKIIRDKIQPLRLEFLTVKSAARVTFVRLKEIDWIEAADYYAGLHVGAKVHLLRRSISELEHDLDPALFCRIHRSSIVNLDRVCGLKLNQEGEYDVLLEGGVALRLSRSYRKQLQSRLAGRSLPRP
jgi:two-component system LytT family response regulator